VADPSDPLNSQRVIGAGKEIKEFAKDLKRTGPLRGVRDLALGITNQAMRIRRNISANSTFKRPLFVIPATLNPLKPSFVGKVGATFGLFEAGKIILEKTTSLERAGTPRQFLNIIHERMHEQLAPSFGQQLNGPLLNAEGILQNMAALKSSLEEVQHTLDHATPIDNFIKRSLFESTPVIRRYKHMPHRLNSYQITALKKYNEHQLERLEKITSSLRSGTFTNEAQSVVESMVDDIQTRFQRDYNRFPGMTGPNGGTIMHEDREILIRGIIEGYYSKHERKQKIEVPPDQPPNPEKHTIGTDSILRFWNTRKGTGLGKPEKQMAKIYMALYTTGHQSEFLWGTRRLFDRQGGSAGAVLDVDKNPVGVHHLIPEEFKDAAVEAYIRQYGTDPTKMDPEFMDGLSRVNEIRRNRADDHSPDDFGPRAGQAFWEEKSAFWKTALRYPQGRLTGISPAILVDKIDRPIRMWAAKNVKGLKIAPGQNGEWASDSYKFRYLPGFDTVYKSNAQSKQARKWLGYGPKKVDDKGEPVPKKHFVLGSPLTWAANVMTFGMYAVWRPIVKVAAPVAAGAFIIEALGGAMPDSWQESKWVGTPTSAVIYVTDGIGDLAKRPVALGLDWANKNPAAFLIKAKVPGDSNILGDAADELRASLDDNNGFGKPEKPTVKSVQPKTLSEIQSEAAGGDSAGADEKAVAPQEQKPTLSEAEKREAQQLIDSMLDTPHHPSLDEETLSHIRVLEKLGIEGIDERTMSVPIGAEGKSRVVLRADFNRDGLIDIEDLKKFAALMPQMDQTKLFIAAEDGVITQEELEDLATRDMFTP